ncbi:MAG: ABC transporter substrate-binding protein [Desulfobacteraceae bacterium]|nr:MAG: ABC transporter substrate-binding protein [Desulfobacteraceae bacterium]
MPFRCSIVIKIARSYPWRIGLLVFGWFVLISALHISLNTEGEKRPVIRMGYMPVITNLAAPLLDAASKADSPIRFKAIKFASFSEMAEALRNEKIQAAFIIAPLSIVLHQQGADIRIVYIGNRHESTLVVRKDLQAKTFTDLEGCTVAVPMRYSGHNLALLKMIGDAGMKDRIRIVEMNPPDMASALAAGSLDAYFVGEPFAAQTLKFGYSDLLLYVEQVWPDFICNLLVVKQRWLEREPETVQALVQSAARSGMWARSHISQAARIASQYWGQPEELVEFALTSPRQRIIYDKFMPRQDELQRLADMMKTYDLIASNDISGLVQDRFARQSDMSEIDDLKSIVRNLPR